MQKKFLVSAVLFLIFFFIITINISYAINIDTNSLGNNYYNSTNTNNINNTRNTTTNNTNQTLNNTATNNIPSSYTASNVQVNSSSLPEAELGLSNILNIILIVVGILLVLLGIAILLRIK